MLIYIFLKRKGYTNEENSIDFFCFCINIFVENKTDTLLYYTMDNVSLNGFMNDPFWGIDVAPGKKAYVRADWGLTALELTGTEKITDIEFIYDIYDDETYGDEFSLSDSVVIYPYGEAAYQVYERTPKDTDIVLFDNEYATMVVLGTEVDDFWGYKIKAYLVNKTDTNILFSIEDAKVNGVECNNYWSELIGAGKKVFVDITWSEYALENVGIDVNAISNVEMLIDVFDDEDYSKDAYVSESYTVTNKASEVPDTWKETTVDNAELAFYYPLTSDDGFAENINIMLQDLSEYDMDLEAYKDLSISQYEASEYTIVSLEKGTVDGIDAYALLVTTSVNSADGSTISCVLARIFAIRNEVAYIFTLAADEAGYNLLGEEVFTMFSEVDFY